MKYKNFNDLPDSLKERIIKLDNHEIFVHKKIKELDDKTIIEVMNNHRFRGKKIVNEYLDALSGYFYMGKL